MLFPNLWRDSREEMEVVFNVFSSRGGALVVQERVLVSPCALESPSIALYQQYTRVC